RVIETGESMLLDVEGVLAAPLAERLEQLVFSEDVQVKNVSGELAELGVHGPLAPDVVGQLAGTPADGLRSMGDYDNLKTHWANGPADLIIVRDDKYRMPGFDVYVSDLESAGRIVNLCLESGVVMGDEAVAEVLRIEAGRPRFGVDMDTDTIPL